MNIRLSSLLLAAFVATPVAALADSKEMQPGMWEMRVKMEMPGMPAGMMGEQVMKHCVKPGEGKWTDVGEKDKSCQVLDLKEDGNKISWKLKCKDGMSGEGKVTRSGTDAYKSEMTMNSKDGTMKMTSAGKRIASSCEKK